MPIVMKRLYMWLCKVSAAISYLKLIGHRLSYLAVKFALPVCTCWLCVACQGAINPTQRQYTGLIEYDSLLQEVPIDINPLPRLILGQLLSMKGDTGCLVPRHPDITVDIEPGADIQGDAWDVATIKKIKDHNKYQGKFSAIIFERISPLPLYWGTYLQAFFGQPINDVYQFPEDFDKLVNQGNYPTNWLKNRANRKEFYSKQGSTFCDLEKISVSALQLPNIDQVSLFINPECVTLTHTQVTLFQEKQGNKSEIPQLEHLIFSIPPAENTILKDYYELLAPGGLLIFSSTASVINRYGTIIKYQKKKYTPFQDLDDPQLQAVYRSIFERAGFVDIRFYKDPYFAETVILLVAKKP